MNLTRIEKLLQRERDPVKRWHYRKVIKEAIKQIDDMLKENERGQR